MIQMFLGFPRSHFPDCDPEVETEGSDGCRPRPEALESGKGQIHPNVVTFVRFGLVWFGLGVLV